MNTDPRKAERDAEAIKRAHPILDYVQRLHTGNLHQKCKTKNGGYEYAGPCPICKTGDDRFVLWTDSERALCRICGFQGDVIDLEIALYGGTFVEACDRLEGKGPRPPRRPPPPPRPGRVARPAGVKPPPKALKPRKYTTPTLVDTAVFEDRDGHVGLKKERYEPGYPGRDQKPRDKSFKLYHIEPGGRDPWVLGRPPADGPPLLLNFRSCVEAPAGATLYWTEGELKAKPLAVAGRLATCTWEGASAWRAEYAEAARDKHVIILQDNDEAGALRTERMIPDLQAVALSIKIVSFPECGEGGDLVDWLNSGHTLADLDSRVADLPPAWTRPDPNAPASLPGGVKPVRYLDDAAWDAMEAPSWIVDKLVLAGAVNVWYGKSGSGKSHLALDLAAHIAAGRLEWWGHAITTTGPIYYVAAEGPQELALRRRAWKAAHELPQLPGFGGTDGRINLLEPDAVARVLASIPADAKPVLIVVDTLARSMPGGDEQTARDINLVYEAAEQLRDATGAAVILIHHEGKDSSRGARGSSAIIDNARQALGISLDDGLITVQSTKHNNTGEQPPLRFVLRPVTDPATGIETVIPALAAPADYDHSGPLSPVQQTVLEILCSPVFNGNATSKELCDVAELSGKNVYRTLNGLIARELVSAPQKAGTVGRRFYATQKGYEKIGRTPPGDNPPPPPAPPAGRSSAYSQLVTPGDPPAQAQTTGGDGPLTGPPVSTTDNPDSQLTHGTDATDAPLTGTDTPLTTENADSHTLTPPYKGVSVSRQSESDDSLVRPSEPSPPLYTAPPLGAPPPPFFACGHCKLHDYVWLRTGGWICRCQVERPPGSPPQGEPHDENT